jgi:hypothetical protein
MPNSYKNTVFAPDGEVDGDEDASSSGFREIDENESELKEDIEDEPEESSSANGLAEENDFDLNEDFDIDASRSALSGRRPAPADVSFLAEALSEKSEEDEVLEDDEAEKDDEAEESDLEPAIADNPEDNGEDYENDSEDSLLISRTKIILAKKLLENIRENNERLQSLLGGLIGDDDDDRISIAEIGDGLLEAEDGDGQVVEGIFDGENMIGPDGKVYGVPANYASKSKLVEGDMLKLTITGRGTFRYKQTKPIERRRLIGKLEKDSNGNYVVLAEKKKFKVITASITYYKGVSGDKVVLLVPVAGDSSWGAVENVIKSK